MVRAHFLFKAVAMGVQIVLMWVLHINFGACATKVYWAMGIVVSDQQVNKFQVFHRHGNRKNPHLHRLVRIVKAQTNESDGSESLALPMGTDFPKGIFVAMSDDRTFHFYRLEDIIGE